MQRRFSPSLPLVLTALAVQIPALAQERREVPANPTPPPVAAGPAGSSVQATSSRAQDPNPLRVALLRWWDANQAGVQVALSAGPTVLAFGSADTSDLLSRCPSGWTPHQLSIDVDGARLT